MKKTVLFIASLFIVCVLAYFCGYYIAVSGTAKQQSAEKITLQPSARNSGEAESPGEHYIAKIERDMLFIYEMPENIIYDSMRTETMHFPAGEIPALMEGVVFQTLPEVYEFLENSMS